MPNASTAVHVLLISDQGAAIRLIDWRLPETLVVPELPKAQSLRYADDDASLHPTIRRRVFKRLDDKTYEYVGDQA